MSSSSHAGPYTAAAAAPGWTSMLRGCSVVSSRLWAKTAVKNLQHAWDAAADGLDTRMPLEMFYNFVKWFHMSSMGSALWSCCIQDVPLSRIDVSLHDTAAFRPLLLFRLHENSHQALTFISFSLVSRRRHYFSLTEAHTESFVWTLCMINIY